MSSLYCPKCNMNVSGKFCTECGSATQAQVETLACTKCGVVASGKFCVGTWRDYRPASNYIQSVEERQFRRGALEMPLIKTQGRTQRDMLRPPLGMRTTVTQATALTPHRSCRVVLVVSVTLTPRRRQPRRLVSLLMWSAHWVEKRRSSLRRVMYVV